LDERLLDAAEQLIIERGYEGLSPADAARGAALDSAAELPSQWELFAGVMERDEARFNTVVDEALAETKGPGAQLLALIEACVVQYDWRFWIELWSQSLRDERARQLRDKLEIEFRTRIAGVIEDGRKAGEFSVDDADATAVAIGTLIDALAVEATLGDTTVSPNFMLGACATAAGSIVGTELKLRGRSDDA
jgi:AcrR family transcriptional regulator